MPHVLTTFGQNVAVYRGDDLLVLTQGIFARELKPVGGNEAVMSASTVITLSAELKLRRDDLVMHEGRRFFVDRKISDNGRLVKWQLHDH